MFLRLAVLVCALGFSNFASAADASAGVFGVPAGIYRGAGVAAPGEMFLPNLDFVSMRKLENGVITAKTRASFWGMQIAELNAHLKIVPSTTPNRFQVLDLDRAGAPCGSAVCSSQGCTFAVTVMNGKLSLKETWVPTASGFVLKNGSQLFNGLSSTYDGQFSRIR